MRVARGKSETDSDEKTSKAVESSKSAAEPREPGFFGRIARFFSQVGAELKKVVTPTRKELVNYVVVVLVFVVFMMLLVTGLDLVFGFGASWVFGNGQELFPAAPATTPAG